MLSAMCFQNIEVTFVCRPLIVREIICERQTIWVNSHENANLTYISQLPMTHIINGAYHHSIQVSITFLPTHLLTVFNYQFFRLTHGKCQSALLHCIMTHIWLA